MFITIREVRRREKVSKMSYKTKFNKVNVLIGSTFCLFGIVTLPFPTGSIFLIGFGISLFFNPLSIKLVFSNLVNDIEFKLWSLWVSMRGKWK